MFFLDFLFTIYQMRVTKSPSGLFQYTLNAFKFQLPLAIFPTWILTGRLFFHHPIGDKDSICTKKKPRSDTADVNEFPNGVRHSLMTGTIKPGSTIVKSPFELRVIILSGVNRLSASEAAIKETSPRKKRIDGGCPPKRSHS